MSEDPKSKEPGTSIVSWRDKMAVVAAQAAESEAPKGGWLSFKGGRMSYNDEQIPGDKLNVVILDFILENAWFPDKYDQKKTVTPSCYAFARVEADLEPHDEAPDPQGSEEGTCFGCPKNEWGSNPEGGRGKACKNSRRIAIITSDVLAHGADGIRKTSPVMCKIPVTSLHHFSSHINRITRVLGTAPFGVISELSVVPSSNIFDVVWKVIDQVTDEEALGALAAKYDAIQKLMFAPYPVMDEPPPTQRSTKY